MNQHYMAGQSVKKGTKTLKRFIAELFILDIFMRLYTSLFQNPPKSIYYCIILSAYLFVPVSIWAPQLLHRNHMLGEIPLFS